MINKILSENKIACCKYNYCLEEGIQNYKSQEAYLQVSKDYKYLYVVNRKPNIKEVYVQGKHWEEVQQMKMYYKTNRDEKRDYKEKISSASCYIEDI